MADFEMFPDEIIAKAIKSFQQKLMDADNFQGGDRPDYKEFWLALRTEGPMILNATKHLFAEHLRNKDNG